MNKLLVTTALKETWQPGTQASYTFLGEWCRLYSEKKIWEALPAEVVPFHWDDRTKLKADHDYLKALYERMLPILGNQLNIIHGVNEPIQFWRILLGPWLITYLPIIFDRWEMLRIAFEKRESYTSIRLKSKEGYHPVAQHFTAFLELMQTDVWNFFIYQRILNDKYSTRVDFIDIETPLSEPVFQTPAPSIKQKILTAADTFFGMFGGKKGVLFYNAYFPPAKLVSLNIALSQVPRMYSNTFAYEYHLKADNNIRNTYIVEGAGDSVFEVFLFANLFKDIPVAYLEEFGAIRERTNKLTLSHHTIVTASSYWGDEVFKMWAAKKQQQGKRLVICQHGGSFPPWFDTFQHEEDIADRHVTWFKPFHPKHIQLAPNKIVKGKNETPAGTHCSVIGFECPRFSYRATAGAITHQAISFFEQTATFCELLDESVKDKLKIRPYPNMGWQTKQRYSDRFSSSAIDSSPSYSSFLQNAKLIVCTYPQTTFSEAMASGKPVILLYVPEYNELIPETKPLMEVLKKANIVFTDPVIAANHINSVWNTIDEWWSSPKVVEARTAYYDTALRVNSDWKKEWTEFLKAV